MMPRSCVLARHQLVELLLHDVLARGRNALLALELFLAEGHRRMRELHVVEAGRVLHQRAGRDRRRQVVLGLEAAAHMAGADAQLQDAGHVRRLRKAEAFLHHAHHHAQVGPRIEQAHAGLQRIGVGALLDHRGAFAVVLAHHDQRAALDAGRGQVGQRVRRRRWCRRWTSRSPRRAAGSGSRRPAWRRPRLRWRRLRRARPARPCRAWPAPSRPAGATPARPGSRRHRPRRTAAAPW